MNATDLSQHFAFSGVSSMQAITSQLMIPALSIISVAVLFYFIAGGYKFLTSGGDKNAVEDGRKMITHAAVGALLLIFMFLIIKLIPEILALPGLILIQ